LPFLERRAETLRWEDYVMLTNLILDRMV